MKFHAALILTLSLAACGKGGDAPAGPANSVKAVAAPAGQDWTQVVAKTAEGYVMGNPNASLKLVEYGSRLCPTCGAFARDGYRPLTDTYVKTGKISFEFREFLVHGAMDVPPALLGTCVGAEPFFPLLEQMFANQQSLVDALQKAPPAAQQAIEAAPLAQRFRLMGETMGLVDFAKQRGVPAAQVEQCLSNTAEIDRLTKQTQDKGPGGDATVSGTPTFILNGKRLDGAISWPAVEAALKQAGA